MSLTAEPSNSQERADLDLPPKSYANAIQDTNGEKEENDSKSDAGQVSNGVSEPLTHATGDTDTTIYDQHNRATGEHVKSVKTDGKYEELTRQAKSDTSEKRSKERRKRDYLVSGKKAGENWKKSRYNAQRRLSILYHLSTH